MYVQIRALASVATQCLSRQMSGELCIEYLYKAIAAEYVLTLMTAATTNHRNLLYTDSQSTSQLYLQLLPMYVGERILTADDMLSQELAL